MIYCLARILFSIPIILIKSKDISLTIGSIVLVDFKTSIASLLLFLKSTNVTIPLSENEEGIIFSRKLPNSESETYGIITTEGEVLQNAYYSAIYYTQKNGKITYWFNKLENNKVISLKEFLSKNK